MTVTSCAGANTECFVAVTTSELLVTGESADVVVVAEGGLPTIGVGIGRSLDTTNGTSELELLAGVVAFVAVVVVIVADDALDEAVVELRLLIGVDEVLELELLAVIDVLLVGCFPLATPAANEHAERTPVNVP